MTNKEDPSYYAIIPASVRYHKKITPNAKLLYGEISCLANKHGHCWAGNKYFANLYKKNKATISVWIKSLEDHGFIKCVYEDNNHRRIYIDGYLEKSKEGIRKIYIDPLEKSKDINNTSNIKNNTVAAKGNNGLISSKNDNISKSFDYRMSSKLYESLAKKRKIMRKVNLVAWSKQFAKFRSDNNLSKVEFKQTLIWYCKNIGGEFVPRAYAAKTFCDKYVNILDAKDPPKDKSIPQEEKYERFKVDEYGNAY